jgi:catechol 2,3-dioxygenase-like lactoylglutathione lyase family enzyme
MTAKAYAVAREHGFPSWRALKADIDQRTATDVDRFVRACKQGDTAAVRALLRENPTLVHAREGHNATGLYFAAAAGHRETVLALLEAGANVHDRDDVHELGVIGWVAQIHGAEPGRIPHDVLALLLERGARHHIFSAIELGDPDAVRGVVEENPAALDDRMSRLDHRQTPLHFAITRLRHDMLDALLELGADVDAVDGNGHTALEYAMLRGDSAATTRLLAAGARKPQTAPYGAHKPDARFAPSVQKGVPIVRVRDVAATLRWYASIGFTEVGRYPDDGTHVFWGMVSLGQAELMFEPGISDAKSVTLLFVTDRIHDLYQFLKSRQIRTASAGAAEAGSEGRSVRFVEDLHEPIFGGLQFSVQDPDGYVLRFLQESKEEGQ